MTLHRVIAESQALGDFRVGHALRHQLQNLHLPLRQL